MPTNRQAAVMRRIINQTTDLHYYAPKSEHPKFDNDSVCFPIKRGAASNKTTAIEVLAAADRQVSVVFWGGPKSNRQVLDQKLDLPIEELERFIFEKTGIVSCTSDRHPVEDNSRGYRMTRW
ncbi:MAG: hypothetical protein KJ587_06995 [Alphaproteobacteria bacterium]|nr:hypothetical protein [Alphaproteobacteria bacterium]